MKKNPHSARNKQLLLYGLLLVVVGAAMAALNHCSRSQVAAMRSPLHHSGGDTIDVAIEYSPATYYTYADTIGGYSHDLLEQVSQLAQRPIKFWPIVTLSTALEALQQGQCDIVVAQYPLTADARDDYAFTRPVHIDKQVLVGRAGPEMARSQLDLAGDTVWIVKGSPMRDRIASLSREIGDTIHVAVDEVYGPEQLVLRVASGEIKYAVVNGAIAHEMAQRVPGLDVSLDISLSQFQSWIVKHDNLSLRDSLDSWISVLQADTAAYNGLQRRYYGTTVPVAQ